MGRAYREHSVFSCIIVCSLTIFGTTDGGSITWFDPPPFETVTDSSIISAVNRTLTKGFPDEELSCNFNLTADLSLITASMKYDAWTIATYLESEQALSVEPTFVSRLNATWVPNELTLILFSVTDADKGEYRCEVVTFGGSVQTWTRKIQVSLLVPPRITEITGTLATEGTNVTLKCIVEGKPTPSIRWTRLFDNLNVTMPLINIRREDARSYRCTAHNGVGTSDSKDFFIDVLYPVKAKGPGENVSVTEGEVTIFSCPVEGNPQPNITWYRMGGAKISSEKQLTLKGKIEESGCYICVANNSLGMPVTVPQCVLVIGKEVPTAFTTTTATPDSVPGGPPWPVIGIVAGVVLLVIVIGVLTWWVRKKRKSRMETKQEGMKGELQHLEDGHKDNLEGLQ